MPCPTLRSLLLSLAACASLVCFAGCAHHNAPATADAPKTTDAAPAPEQLRFPSPEQAAATLKDAVLQKDRLQLLAIFGPEGRQLVFTGDRVAENNAMTSFGQHMTDYLRVDHRSATQAVLHIGGENWPFPIPLVKGSDGWSFDTNAGKEEILNRRIGENELGAIEVCRAYVIAQTEYARRDRTGEKLTQYAQRFRSTDGKRDGLYWPVAEGESLSPMGPLVAEAQAEGYAQRPPDGKPHPYHGYYFHILTAQGPAVPGGKMSYLKDGHLTQGFALIASPSAWGASGIMTFQVNQDGKIFEKNLGPQTKDLVKTLTEYNPDSSWSEVKD